MNEELVFRAIAPGQDPGAVTEVRALLASCGLGLEPTLQLILTCRQGNRLVACAGLEDDIVKCVAIAPDHQGDALGLTLMNELGCLALERGHAHLFLYTKPGNVPLFRGCGFHPLAEVPGWAALLENTPVGIQAYAARLRSCRHAGRMIGCVVLNANPFTFGHQYLIRQAARSCDWLHVFVLGEDAATLPHGDRFRMVEAGTAGIERITLHHGSRYMISRATFPSYFIKDARIVESCDAAIDLLLFRKHIAPALGVTHRFVGTEPYCRLTRKYNQDMRTWLADAPAVQVVELPRLEVSGRAVSASEVRRLLKAGDFAAMEPLAPRTTLELLPGGHACQPAHVLP